MSLSEHYARIRREHPTLSALQAVRWARHEVAVDAFLSDIGWDGPNDRDWPRDARYSLALVANLAGGSIRVHWDEEPYDWGDMEPSDHERENLSVIGVEVLDANGEHLDSCWGYGFTSGDVEREAASFALEMGAVQTIEREASERAYWSARDVLTVDA
jgi:hypothetical protein